MVRQIIQKEGHVVIEHHGGDYNPDLLLSTHCLVLVPASNILAKTPSGNKNLANITTANITYGHHVGKGQYEQIKSFWKNSCIEQDHKDKGRMFLDSTIICLEEIGETEIYAGACDSINANEGGDWKVSYANLEINSSLDNLKTLLHHAETQNKVKGINTNATNIHDVSAGIGKTFVPKSYGHAEISAMQIPADATVIKQSDGSFTIHRNGNTEEEWMKRADGRIVFPKQTKDGETYVKDCFDGTPHLACALLYNL